MERLFRIENVFSKPIPGRNEGDPERAKVEVTLCYHETYYSSQSGPGIHKQMIQVVLFDDAANNFNLQKGQWLVGSVSMTAYPSKTEPGRMNPTCYLERYIPITDWNVL